MRFFVLFMTIFCVCFSAQAKEKCSSSDEICRIKLSGFGQIVGDNILLRDRPKGKYLGVLPDKITVKILSKSKDKYKIDGEEHHWIEIQKDHLTGWVYGKFIKLDEGSESKYNHEESLIFIYAERGDLKIVKDLLENRGYELDDRLRSYLNNAKIGKVKEIKKRLKLTAELKKICLSNPGPLNLYHYLMSSRDNEEYDCKLPEYNTSSVCLRERLIKNDSKDICDKISFSKVQLDYLTAIMKGIKDRELKFLSQDIASKILINTKLLSFMSNKFIFMFNHIREGCEWRLFDVSKKSFHILKKTKECPDKIFNLNGQIVYSYFHDENLSSITSIEDSSGLNREGHNLKSIKHIDGDLYLIRFARIVGSSDKLYRRYQENKYEISETGAKCSLKSKDNKGRKWLWKVKQLSFSDNRSGKNCFRENSCEYKNCLYFANTFLVYDYKNNKVRSEFYNISGELFESGPEDDGATLLGIKIKDLKIVEPSFCKIGNQVLARFEGQTFNITGKKHKTINIKSCKKIAVNNMNDLILGSNHKGSLITTWHDAFLGPEKSTDWINSSGGDKECIIFHPDKRFCRIEDGNYEDYTPPVDKFYCNKECVRFLGLNNNMDFIHNEGPTFAHKINYKKKDNFIHLVKYDGLKVKGRVTYLKGNIEPMIISESKYFKIFDKKKATELIELFIHKQIKQ